MSAKSGRDASREVWLWWSSGKDSAWALHTLRVTPGLRVSRLVTTLNGAAERVAMHAVRRRLLEAQARALGLPLTQIELPSPCTNAEYQRAVEPVLEAAVREGVPCMAFGDLSLEDVRAYRLSLLERHPIEPLFPIWGRDTRALSEEMLARGLRAYVTCVDPGAVSAKLAGSLYDAAFLAALPEAADPCGENGEFHTFVFDGPMFKRGLSVVPGEVVERDGFVFADLRPADEPGPA